MASPNSRHLAKRIQRDAVWRAGLWTFQLFGTSKSFCLNCFEYILYGIMWITTDCLCAHYFMVLPIDINFWQQDNGPPSLRCKKTRTRCSLYHIFWCSMMFKPKWLKKTKDQRWLMFCKHFSSHDFQVFHVFCFPVSSNTEVVTFRSQDYEKPIFDLPGPLRPPAAPARYKAPTVWIGCLMPRICTSYCTIISTSLPNQYCNPHWG